MKALTTAVILLENGQGKSTRLKLQCSEVVQGTNPFLAGPWIVLLAFETGELRISIMMNLCSNIDHLPSITRFHLTKGDL